MDVVEEWSLETAIGSVAMLLETELGKYETQLVSKLEQNEA